MLPEFLAYPLHMVGLDFLIFPHKNLIICSFINYTEKIQATESVAWIQNSCIVNLSPAATQCFINIGYSIELIFPGFHQFQPGR